MDPRSRSSQPDCTDSFVRMLRICEKTLACFLDLRLFTGSGTTGLRLSRTLCILRFGASGKENPAPNLRLTARIFLYAELALRPPQTLRKILCFSQNDFRNVSAVDTSTSVW